MNYYIDKTSIIDEDVSIGEGTKIWSFCHVESGAVIGNNSQLGQNVFIDRNVCIGSNVKIQNNVSVYEGVVIEDGVFLGPSCVFTNDLTPRALYPKGRENRIKTFVKKGATVGANATIVCGITIGRFAMIGAGTVVSKNVKDYALVYGSKGIQVGWVCECGSKLGDELVCTNCKKKYVSYKDGIRIE